MYAYNGLTGHYAAHPDEGNMTPHLGLDRDINLWVSDGDVLSTIVVDN
jgi:hypothetical protein